MEKIKITSGPNSILVNSEIKIFDDLSGFDFLYKYIPLVEISKDSIANKETFVLSIKDNKKLDFEFFAKENNAVLECTFNKNITLRDIVSVIDYCLDYIRQKEGIYNLHGSAVAKNEKGILIIGGVSGLGKTTLALNLCTKRRFNFIGDEKILIDKNGFILGGVNTIEFNKPDLNSSSAPELNNKGPNELSKFIDIQKRPVPIKLVIQPMIIPGANLYVEDWPTIKAEWHLYEEMGRKIRGVSRRLNNHSFPLQSIDTFEVSLLRSNTAKKLSRKIKFVGLKGDVNNIMDKIESLLTTLK